MGTCKRRFRRFFRRHTRTAPGHGPGVSRMMPGDPEYCEYARYLMSPRRMMMTNFVAGLMRGIGMAVGFSLLGAAAVVLLEHFAWRNVPWIGEFVARIMEVAEARK